MRLDQEQIVVKLNSTMIGWANYFCSGPVSKAYRAIDRHASEEAASVAVCQAPNLMASD